MPFSNSHQGTIWAVSLGLYYLLWWKKCSFQRHWDSKDTSFTALQCPGWKHKYQNQWPGRIHEILQLLMSGKFWANFKKKFLKLYLWNILNPSGIEKKSVMRWGWGIEWDSRDEDLGIIWQANYMQPRVIYLVTKFILISISKCRRQIQLLKHS